MKKKCIRFFPGYLKAQGSWRAEAEFSYNLACLRAALHEPMTLEQQLSMTPSGPQDQH